MKKYRKPELIRPIIYKAFTMLAVAAVLALLWDRLVNTAGFYSARTHVLPIFGVFFLILAWFCFLRLDGVRLPSLRKNQKKNRKQTGSMMDAVGTEPENDEELSRGERDFCSLAAALLSGIFCLVFGLL